MMFEHLQRLANRHEFHVYTYSDANHDFCDIRPFARTHQITPFKTGKLYNSPFGRINNLIRWLDLGRLRNLDRRMAVDIEKKGFDLVWVHPSKIQNSPALLHFTKNIPTIFYCQEPLRILYEKMPARPYDRPESRLRTMINFIDPFYNLFFNTLKKNDLMNIVSANHILVNSNFMRSIVAQIYPVEPVTNYGGVNLDFFYPIDLPKDDYLFSVGSLTPLKGFDFIIRSLATLPESDRLPLFIACNFVNPEEKAYLEQLATVSGVELRLKTGISDESLREHYNRARLTICASIREPFGLVPIEAMACGAAVLAVSEGGFLETIEDQKTGVLAPRDETIFGATLRELIGNKEKLNQLGKNGRQSVEQHWAWQHSADRFANLLAGFTGHMN